MYKKYIIGILMIGVIGLGLFQSIKEEEAFRLERKGENLIRFHVLANSDDPEDQLLKLRVRDEVIEAMAEELEGSSGIAESREIILNNLEKMEVVAEKKIFEEGKDYKVTAMLVEDTFPTKRYGGVVFPAGKYEALKIVIGEGAGENWWCVMFPPLCFVDVKNGLTDERTQRELKNTLSEEEYRLYYSAANKEEVPLQLRSKLVEVFRSSKNQLNRFASIF
ncbi:stage II sporulation protein R [Clostridium formicaceticum]|uniref:Stage II sporulation protein R n=1 Tax=Clostridium formicaceticum TaxID=1497 RepID=A0AAC9RRR9_9CLOT|nr:stage II sporulation protein R [Clostridium formicaceticum]AOY75177.1 stage II sporulation protein R [Clostridium formicaceticum]ARE89603.1 Stage II sporulation protein R (spore_II_R) [Clostridium formicaceticum]